MSLATFLVGLRETLATGLGCDVEDGEVEGPLELTPGTRHACVWPASTEEVEGDVYHEQVAVRLRVFLPIEQEFAPGQPIPTDDLVQARADVIDVLRPHQTGAFGVSFYRVTRFDFYPRAQRLETTIVGWQCAEFQKPVGP
jgi:hypothetical protein